MSLPNRWQLIQKSMNHFWTRWSQEYVSQLQQRSKWCKPQPNIKEGSLVLIKNEQQPPLPWKIKRISKVFPGDDARIRVVEVKTANGTYRRPIVKLSAALKGIVLWWRRGKKNIREGGQLPLAVRQLASHWSAMT
ncbi:hypothetical protein LAZ67_8001295 [Cordylochernes scorpioides]|uniref:DUF5641 domain-containing protein n=1 Tax=Cordylochernes scorpioides TaxID=51811 RepID=A0ABY6KQ39_9ARAC|nr:hypothetical protein LAZ67_8001295 [Cordylochernes scorpioides]